MPLKTGHLLVAVALALAANVSPAQARFRIRVVPVPHFNHRSDPSDSGRLDDQRLEPTHESVTVGPDGKPVHSDIDWMGALLVLGGVVGSAGLLRMALKPNR